MKQLVLTVTFTYLTLCCLLIVNIEAYACNTPAIPSLASYTVRNADVVVRATAIEFVENDGVRFRVEEVLRGEDVPSTFVFIGHLTSRDDFNNRPVPYNHVRSSGDGPCYAYEYKQNVEYLLLLKRNDEILTPYWYPLAPTNEQLRSADDEWIRWVKDYLQNHEEQDANAGNIIFRFFSFLIS